MDRAGIDQPIITSLEPATLLATSPELLPSYPPTPTILLVMKSLPVKLNLAIAGVPEVLSAVKSMHTPYPLVGYSRVNARSTTKLTWFPKSIFILSYKVRLYLHPIYYYHKQDAPNFHICVLYSFIHINISFILYFRQSLNFI